MRVEDDFKDYHQTEKLYQEMRDYYDGEITPATPFPIVAVKINDAVRHFAKKRQGKKPMQKIVYLSLKYLDEIGYQ